MPGILNRSAVRGREGDDHSTNRPPLRGSGALMMAFELQTYRHYAAHEHKCRFSTCRYFIIGLMDTNFDP